MTEIIDLSQEIYEGMTVYKDLPQVKMTIHNSHEEWSGINNPKIKTPAVHKLELGEHTGTHVDAINHMEIHVITSYSIHYTKLYDLHKFLDLNL